MESILSYYDTANNSYHAQNHQIDDDRCKNKYSLEIIGHLKYKRFQAIFITHSITLKYKLPCKIAKKDRSV